MSPNFDEPRPYPEPDRIVFDGKVIPNPYVVLGLTRTASQTEIKKAYRHLAWQYHPDYNKTEHASEFFRRLHEAYTLLTNLEKKHKVDQALNNSRRNNFVQGESGVTLDHEVLFTSVHQLRESRDINEIVFHLQNIVDLQRKLRTYKYTYNADFDFEPLLALCTQMYYVINKGIGAQSQEFLVPQMPKEFSFLYQVLHEYVERISSVIKRFPEIFRSTQDWQLVSRFLTVNTWLHNVYWVHIVFDIESISKDYKSHFGKEQKANTVSNVLHNVIKSWGRDKRLLPKSVYQLFHALIPAHGAVSADVLELLFPQWQDRLSKAETKEFRMLMGIKV